MNLKEKMSTIREIIDTANASILARTGLKILLEIPAKDRTYETVLVDMLLREASDLSGIPVYTIVSKTRMEKVLVIRYACIQVLKERTRLTYMALGEVFNRDHATIMNALVEAKKMAEQDYKDYNSWYEKFDEYIKQFTYENTKHKSE